MSAVLSMKRSAAPLNPHLIGGLALIILLGSASLGVLLFGNPASTMPRALAPVPPAQAADAQLAEAVPPPRSLRGDALGLDDPMLNILADPPADATDVVLPGVAPIDETAPVRTRAELAAAAAEEAGGLAAAPLSGLTEEGPGGLLPVIGPDGVRPADAYARPFEDNGLPRVAVVVGGLGFDTEGTRRAIAELPPQVTLGFTPYAPDLQSLIDQARAAGHEVLIELPMEPFDYPQNDPGEHTLLTTAGASANIGRLEWLMSRATGYFAVINYLGEKFMNSEPALAPVLTEIAGRGVDMIFEGATASSPLERAGEAAGLRWAAADRALDTSLTAGNVQTQLAQLEALALQNGASMGYGLAYPVVVDEVLAWTAEMEQRGYALAPASAVLDLKAEARGE